MLDNPGNWKFVSTPDLCEQCVTALNKHGLYDIHSFRTKRLKVRLQHCGEQVVFWCFGGDCGMGNPCQNVDISKIKNDSGQRETV